MKVYKEISAIETDVLLESLNSKGCEFITTDYNRNISITLNFQLPYNALETMSIMQFLRSNYKYKLVLEKINENT